VKTEAELKMEQIENALNSLMRQNKLEADVAYTHLTNIIKWLILTIALMFMTIFGSALWCLNNFDIVTESFELEQITDNGNANYIGNDGDIYNGVSKGQEN
jgi:hypothetical protein